MNVTGMLVTMSPEIVFSLPHPPLSFPFPFVLLLSSLLLSSRLVAATPLQQKDVARHVQSAAVDDWVIVFVPKTRRLE